MVYVRLYQTYSLLCSNLFLALKGTADNTIPPRSTSTVISLLPRAQVHVIEGGTHSLILEETLGHSIEVTKALIKFLSSSS